MAVPALAGGAWIVPTTTAIKEGLGLQDAEVHFGELRFHAVHLVLFVLCAISSVLYAVGANRLSEGSYTDEQIAHIVIATFVATQAMFKKKKYELKDMTPLREVDV